MDSPAAAGESPVNSAARTDTRGYPRTALQAREQTHLAHGDRRVRPAIGQRHLTMRTIGTESGAGQQRSAGFILRCQPDREGVCTDAASVIGGRIE